MIASLILFFLPTEAFILKIDRMLLSWVDILADGAKMKLEDPIASVCHSLKFLRPRVELSRTGEKAHNLIMG